MTTHGMSNSPEYLAWLNMRSRCNNPNDREYPRYGARGITVAPEWEHSFEKFYADMGDKPGPEFSLERIENNDGYRPGNCRWATDIEQARNRSNNRRVEHNGVMKTLAQLRDESNIDDRLIWQRLENGWTVDQAIQPPADQKRYIFQGESLTLDEWAARLNVSYITLYMRIEGRGWSLERALTQPFRKSPNKSF